jgi:Tfp pilus assembly protein PilO
MNSTKSTDRFWMIGGALGVAALLAVGWFGFIGPQLDQATGLRGEAAKAHTQMTALEGGLVELRKQYRDLPRYQAELAVDRQALPTTAASSDFLRVLQSLGDRTGAEITGITVATPADVVGNTKVRTLPIIITAAGTSQQLTDLLDQMQQEQPRAVLINTADLAVTDPTGESDTGTLSVNLDAFIATTTGRK